MEYVTSLTLICSREAATPTAKPTMSSVPQQRVTTPKGELVLLGVQWVHVLSDKGTQTRVLFYDSGSTLTLCRHDWAQKAGYEGRPVSIYLKGLAQNYEKLDTKEYEIVLLDTAGRHLKVNAIGLDALTQEVHSKDANRA